MKNIIIACILSFLHLFVSGQNLNLLDSHKTKIYIIGVIHTENQFRNTDSLLNILKDIKPKLILSEIDTLSGFFNSDYKLLEPPLWWKMARKLNLGNKMSPEMEVLYKYLNYDSTIKIFPFDMAFSNRKDDTKMYIKNEKEWVAIVNKAYFENKIPSDLLPLFNLTLKYNHYYVSMLDKSYSDINKNVVSDSIRTFMALEKELNAKLIENLPELFILKAWQTQVNEEWLHRNEVMARNIIRFTEKSKAKRIVVFTGLMHKYYLIDLLNSYNNEKKYELVEYYEK